MGMRPYHRLPDAGSDDCRQVMVASLTLLPRETRDTLLILCTVALVLAPQIAYLPWWTSGLAAALLAWRGVMAWRGQRLPGKWLLAALLALAISATLLQFRSIVGPEAGVALVVLLLVLKTMEMRARRDAMVIFFLSFFCLVTLFLQSQSLLIALAMVLAVWGLLAALVNAHIPTGYPSLGTLLRTSGLLMLWGAPLMLVLFLTFPRLTPLWGLPTNPDKASTGLSNTMTVGQVAELAQDQSVALRVRFIPTGAEASTAQTAPPQRLMYFRGPVLSHFDGRQWTAPNDGMNWPLLPHSSEHPTAQGLSERWDYEMTLEPHQKRWLLTLDATIARPDIGERRLMGTHDLQWLSMRPITDVLRYQATAHLHYRFGQQLPEHLRRSYLRLPQDLNPRTVALAQSLRSSHAEDDTAIIQAALHRLSTQGYVYTLRPDVVTGTHTADSFWFDNKNGFCEHIASAFVVLMRAADIPARIVTGYQGGERNPVDGLWTVRQSDAHAWAEVWIANEGWLRIDPTSAVAPERIEQLQRLAPPSTVFGNAVGQVVSPDTLQRMRANWEALNHRWNDWVLGYTTRQQTEVLRSLGLDEFSPAKASAWLAALSGMVIAAMGLHRWQRQRIADPWQRLMAQAQHKLRSAGINGTASTGNRALAAAAQAQWGDESLPLQRWLLQMEQWRYAPHGPNTPSLAQLRRDYRALTWPRPRTP